MLKIPLAIEVASEWCQVSQQSVIAPLSAVGCRPVSGTIALVSSSLHVLAHRTHAASRSAPPLTT